MHSCVSGYRFNAARSSLIEVIDDMMDGMVARVAAEMAPMFAAQRACLGSASFVSLSVAGNTDPSMPGITIAWTLMLPALFRSCRTYFGSRKVGVCHVPNNEAGCSVLAQEETFQKTHTRNPRDLKNPRHVGSLAIKRTLRNLEGELFAFSRLVEHLRETAPPCVKRVQAARGRASGSDTSHR